MQQSCLCRRTRPHYSLQVSWLVALDVGNSITITSFRDQHCRIDDQSTKLLEGLAEAWQEVLGRPDIWGRVLGEIFVIIVGSALKLCVLVEGTIDIKRSFESVITAGFEGFFTVRPASQVVGVRQREGIFRRMSAK